jgi:hypothetical protein
LVWVLIVGFVNMFDEHFMLHHSSWCQSFRDGACVVTMSCGWWLLAGVSVGASLFLLLRSSSMKSKLSLIGSAIDCLAWGNVRLVHPQRGSCYLWLYTRKLDSPVWGNEWWPWCFWVAWRFFSSQQCVYSQVGWVCLLQCYFWYIWCNGCMYHL